MSALDAAASLTTLPTELIQHIFSLLTPFELQDVSSTCKHLHNQARTDKLWEQFVQENLPQKLPTPKPCASFRELYIAHHAQWFLTRHRIWFADTSHCGKLIVARYDPRMGSIEAYAVAAERGPAISGVLEWEAPVLYHNFNPKIRLDLNLPVVSLSLKDATVEKRHGKGYQSEILMGNSDGTSSTLSSTFLFATPLPSHLMSSNSSVWPPFNLPSPNCIRSRNESASGFRSAGHRPTTYSKRSDATFRVRKFHEYGHQFMPMQFLHRLGNIGSLGRAQEIVTTFGTLPRECYTPTKEKPWQGIWCGDYSAHGCEFILITQSDGRKPLPEKARLAASAWPSELPVVNGQQTNDADSDDDLTFTDPGLQYETLSSNESSSSEYASPQPESVPRHNEDEAPYRGRLEAIKLTGDPNIPRGEITFVADDIGSEAFLGYATEPIFTPGMKTAENEASNVNDIIWRSGETSSELETSEADSSLVSPDPRGARMYKSVGHVAFRGFTDDKYIPSQVILISADRIAHYWRPYKHISFFQRVDLDKLM